jgi:hypothetical protein
MYLNPTTKILSRVTVTLGTALIAVLMAVLMTTTQAFAAGPPTGQWNFTAELDGKPIGEHRFALSSDGAADSGKRKLESEASFNVRILGMSVYKYHHQATEHWTGDCLASITATTDDDGKQTSVKTSVEGDTMTITTGTGSTTAKGCVMSFAYWDPAMRSQTQLLNAQTGTVDPVEISSAGDGDIDVRGEKVRAERFRITGPTAPVDLWYSAQGDWIGLDSTVAGGRKLTYRLK